MFRCSILLRFLLLAIAGWLALANGRAAEGGDPQLERDTFGLINAYRQADNLPPLEWNAAMAKEARRHSEAMASSEVDFGHAGFGDRMRRLRAALAGMESGGENVFMTDDPRDVAESAVGSWLKSPAHLHNIRGDFNASGMGVWENKEGVIYFTQIFGKVHLALKPPG